MLNFRRVWWGHWFAPCDIQHPIVSMCVYHLIQYQWPTSCAYDRWPFLITLIQSPEDRLMFYFCCITIVTSCSIFSTLLRVWVHVHHTNWPLQKYAHVILHGINLPTPVMCPYTNMDFPLWRVYAVIQNPLRVTLSPVKSTNIILCLYMCMW